MATSTANVFTTTKAAPPLSQRPSEFPIVDSQNTLTDFSSIQHQLIKNSNNNLSADSIICVEKTTTHHNYYDVEKLAGDDTAKNSSIISSANQSTMRPFGMGNPAIIATWGFATVTMLMALHKLVLPTGSNHLMLPTALMYGGLAQFLAGFLVLIGGDSFNGTLFVTFGAYWLGSGMMMVPSVGQSLDVYAINHEEATTTAIYLFLWSFFGLMVCGISLKIKNGSFLLSWCLFFIFLNLFLEACYNLTGIVSLMQASGVACICASVGGYYSGIVDLFAEQGVQMWTGKYKQ
ncbi:GPR1/FUN34/yaaH family-domain-containing protein [Parasitella parasitica]|nr:GPR1/FUN34/yaaH family-domain-containing protein [Parasitella parasitica]